MSRIDDGHSTRISFSASASAATDLFEKSVTPPSVEGGGENDTTTMLNSVYRTKSPKSLITLGDAQAEVAYDPAVYNEIVGMINVNQQITITFPDAHTLVFWGWIDSFSPNPIVEGQQATAAIVIKCSNQNDSGVETAPVYA